MQYLSLHAAAASVPPDGRDPSTVFRWITTGLKVGGRRIKLRAQYHGRRLVTSAEWLDEFSNAITAARLGQFDDGDSIERDDVTESELVAAGLLDRVEAACETELG